MPARPKTLHRCAGCGQHNRPSGYVLCRDCWRVKVPAADKVAFNKLRGWEPKMLAARRIIQTVMSLPPS